MNAFKKPFILLLILLLLMAACNSNQDQPEEAAPQATAVTEEMAEPTEEPMEEEMAEGDVMEELGTVGDIAMADDNFSILVDAVLATGLDTTLQGPGPITVFAPTNDAFAKLPEGTLDSLTEDQLRDILLYHVVEGEVYAADVMGMDMGTSALGEDFMVTVEGETVMINDATIVIADIPASNGVIHVIDTVLLPPMMMGEDMEDMDEEMMTAVLYATSNPGELENDAIVSLATDLNETMLTFDGFGEGLTSIESIAFAADGTAYLTVDTGEGSGSLVGIPEMGMMGESMMMADSEMMMMDGLTAPKGLIVVDDLEMVIVADFGAKAIVAYNRDMTPAFTVTDLGEGERSIWDIYHDAASDTLFATGTDGTLLVYADFSANQGADGPTKTIVPADADGNQISVNLHGVYYVADSDEIILTDVGSASDATDGQLFVIPEVMAANGNTTVSVQIGGPESMLGNPVDVVYHDGSAFVAEKSNDAVLRFDDILASDMMGMMGDAAPSAMIEVVKAESLAWSHADMMMP